MISPDARASNADWTKRTWDLPTEPDALAALMGDLEGWIAFKQLPAFKAIPRGLETQVDALLVDAHFQEFDIHQPRWPKGTPLGGEWRALRGAVTRTVQGPAAWVDEDEMRAHGEEMAGEMKRILETDVMPDYHLRWNGEVEIDEDEDADYFGQKKPECSIVMTRHLFNTASDEGDVMILETSLHELLHSGLTVSDPDADMRDTFNQGWVDKLFEEGGVHGFTLAWGDYFAEHSKVKWGTPEEVAAYRERQQEEFPPSTYIEMVNWLRTFTTPTGFTEHDDENDNDRDFFRWLLSQPLDQRAEAIGTRIVERWEAGDITDEEAADALFSHVSDYAQFGAALFFFEGHTGDIQKQVASLYGSRMVETPFPIFYAMPQHLKELVVASDIEERAADKLDDLRTKMFLRMVESMTRDEYKLRVGVLLYDGDLEGAKRVHREYCAEHPTDRLAMEIGETIAHRRELKRLGLDISDA